MSEITLRAFSWSDVPAITEIYRYYVEETAISFELDAPGQETMAERFSGLLRLRHPLIIGEIDGVVAGYAYASFFRPRPAYRFTCEDSIYLDQSRTGRGLGAALLTELLVQAKACGFKQMLAGITADNKSSITFHERFGFEQVGYYKQVGFKFDRWYDIVHLQKAL